MSGEIPYCSLGRILVCWWITRKFGKDNNPWLRYSRRNGQYPKLGGCHVRIHWFSSTNSEYKNYSVQSHNFACCFTWLWNSVYCIEMWMAGLLDGVLSRLFGRKGGEIRRAEENCTFKRCICQIIWRPANQGWWDEWVMWCEWKSVHAELWWGKH